MRYKGFTLVELLTVLAIISIIATIGFLNFPKFYKNYKFNEYTHAVENIVKLAKIKAIELTENMAICTDTANRSIKIINLGSRRSIQCNVNNTCIGDIRPCVLAKLEIQEGFINLDGWSTGFDPRGFVLRPGRVCIDKEREKYFKVCVSRFGAIRIEKGNGACGTC